MTSLPSFGPDVARESGCANREVDGQTLVELSCATTLSALKRFSEMVEADPTGSASETERVALQDLNNALKSTDQCRCDGLSDFYEKSRTYEALVVWFSPYEPRMQLFASNLVGELFHFLERCRANSGKNEGPPGDTPRSESSNAS